MKAQTSYILFDGGASATSNYSRFFNMVSKSQHILTGLGAPTKVVAKDGKWTMSDWSDAKTYNQAGEITGTNQSSDGAKPRIDYPAQNLSDLDRAIKDTVSTSGGNNIVLYFTGHGGAPSDATKPETSSVMFFGKEYTYNEIQAVLAKYPNTKFKVISDACFSGGVHSISKNLNNVCSSSPVPYFTQFYNGSPVEMIWSRNVWADIYRTKGKTSLAKASFEGFNSDIANVNLGNMSSFDFVDFTLKKGAYAKVFDDIRYESISTTEKNKSSSTDNPKLFDPMYRITPPPGYASVIGTVSAKPSVNFDSCNSGCCLTSSISSDLDKLKNLSQTLSGLAQKAFAQDLDKKADRQPAQVRTVFHEVIDDMTKNGAKYLQTAKLYEDKYKLLVRRWNDHKAKFKDSWAITKWWYGEGDERAKIQKEFDVLKANAQRDLKQYSFNHQMLARLERLDEFSKKATQEQKKKFVQLLQCEWEPL